MPISVMHDASEVIVSIALEGIAWTIISRANIASTVGFVLINPSTGDVTPKHFQVGPMTVEYHIGIWSLLLMVHADEMTNFMNHVAHIPHTIAPAQIHFAIAIPQTSHITTSSVKRANLCLDSCLSVLHKQDACLTHHAPDCLTECLFPLVIQVI